MVNLIVKERTVDILQLVKGKIEVDISTLVFYGDESEEAYDFEGAVKVHCSSCGFTGFVDVDHDGYRVQGECYDCGLQFSAHS